MLVKGVRLWRRCLLGYTKSVLAAGVLGTLSASVTQGTGITVSSQSSAEYIGCETVSNKQSTTTVGVCSACRTACLYA